jgi:hypothetical protein
MNQRTKTILFVILFIILVGLLGFALYYFFFRPFIAPTPPSVNVTPPSGLPPVNVGVPTVTPIIPPGINVPVGPSVTPGAQGAFVPAVSYQATGGITSFGILEKNPVSATTLSTNGTDLIYYEPDSNYFYRITPDGTKERFSDVAFSNVENVTWAPNNQKAVIEYPDGSNIIYDFKTRVSIPLPSQWKDFTFSPDGEQIAFKDIKVDQENRWITVADANGTSTRKIERLGDQDDDVIVSWSPNDQYVAIFRQSIDANRSNLYFIGFNHELNRTVTAEGRDLRVEWSPSGQELAYSVYNSRSDFKPLLWVTTTEGDLLGTGKINTGLNTWVDKCTFASDETMYCAVPREMKTGVGLAPQLADDTPDDFYRINLLTGATSLVAEPIIPTTAEKLIISDDGSVLYWVEKGSLRINKMEL